MTVISGSITSGVSCTGVAFSEERLCSACDKNYSIERAYLAKNGMGRQDDNPPESYFTQPMPSGPFKGMKLDRDKYEALKEAWYELRGADKKSGAPSRATLEAQGLKYVADELEKLGVYR